MWLHFDLAFLQGMSLGLSVLLFLKLIGVTHLMIPGMPEIERHR